MSESYVRLTLGNYVIKSCKWDQKIYVVIMFGSYVRITLQKHVRITSESYIRLALGSYVIKPYKWDQKITF